MKRTTLSLIPALALGLAVSACGSDSSSEPASGSSSDAASESSSDDFTSQSADDIVTAAADAMSGLESVQVAGDLTQAGQQITLDIGVASSGDCTGSIGLGDGTAEVVSVGGESWFKPDEAFWQAQAPSPEQAQQIIDAVGDKWVVQSDGAGFAEFCDLDSLLEGIDDGESTYEAGDETDVEGTPAIEIASTDANGEEATGFVATEDPHYFLKLEKSQGESQGTIGFSAFDEPVDAQAPADDEIVDLDQLGG